MVKLLSRWGLSMASNFSIFPLLEKTGPGEEPDVEVQLGLTHGVHPHLCITYGRSGICSRPGPPPSSRNFALFCFPRKKISLHRCDTSKTLVEIAKSSYVNIYNENLYKDVREFSLVFSPNSCFVWLLLCLFEIVGKKNSQHFLIFSLSQIFPKVFSR